MPRPPSEHGTGQAAPYPSTGQQQYPTAGQQLPPPGQPQYPQAQPTYQQGRPSYPPGQQGHPPAQQAYQPGQQAYQPGQQAYQQGQQAYRQGQQQPAYPPAQQQPTYPPAQPAAPAYPYGQQQAAAYAPVPQQQPAAQRGPGQAGAMIGRDATMAVPTLTAPAPQAGPTQATAPATTQTTAAPAATQAAAAQATAAVATTATRIVATPAAESLAIPDGGHRQPPPNRPPAAHGDQRDFSGRMARLRIGWHTASPAALARLRPTPTGAGLILGADRQQAPVSVRFFQPDPRRFCLVGGVWTAQLIAFRALALGARIMVVTPDPANWRSFGERATGMPGRVVASAVEQPLPAGASAQQPLLVIHDLGTTGSSVTQPLGPWQTRLTVLLHLDRNGLPWVHDSDLVLLQRLDPTEATLLGNALRLGPSADHFQRMPEDMIALVSADAVRYARFAQTDIERQLAGKPRR
ncbi:hypothetical protein [Micromonospora sonneratiae]|uniref:Uncharacterized protein n=1 Tax=Micromonospora sonneratiae TaxID=1184706 RepID=A0ABW3YLR0_9ACTN